MKLIVWMIQKIFRTLNQFAVEIPTFTSRPVSFPPHPMPEGLLWHSFVLPRRKEWPAKHIWHTNGYHLCENDYSFDALQAYCFGINMIVMTVISPGGDFLELILNCNKILAGNIPVINGLLSFFLGVGGGGRGGNIPYNSLAVAMNVPCGRIHFHPKSISSTDTFIQTRFHPMTLSSKHDFIQWHFHPNTISSNDTFIQNTISSNFDTFIQWISHPMTFSSKKNHMWYNQYSPCFCECVAGRKTVIGWKCHWMKMSLDGKFIGWNCCWMKVSWLKCHWMKVSKLDESVWDESVIGRTHFWMKVSWMKLSSLLDEMVLDEMVLDESVLDESVFWMKVFLDEFFFFFAIWMKVFLTVPCNTSHTNASKLDAVFEKLISVLHSVGVKRREEKGRRKKEEKEKEQEQEQE